MPRKPAVEHSQPRLKVKSVHSPKIFIFLFTVFPTQHTIGQHPRKAKNDVTKKKKNESKKSHQGGGGWKFKTIFESTVDDCTLCDDIMVNKSSKKQKIHLQSAHHYQWEASHRASTRWNLMQIHTREKSFSALQHRRRVLFLVYR